MAGLSYLGVLVLIPLLTRKKNPFVYFHAKQGLVIFVGEVIALIAGQWIVVVGSLVFILLLIASVIGLIQALQGRRFSIPGIGQLVRELGNWRRSLACKESVVYCVNAGKGFESYENSVYHRPGVECEKHADGYDRGRDGCGPD